MIEYASHKNNIIRIVESEPGFQITDGWAVYPRAMMYISPDCPQVYRTMIKTAVDKGWIKSVAHIKDTEYTWGKLQE